MATSSSSVAEDTPTMLKCSLCKGYLSIGPVMISTDGKKYQCGRCDFPNENINIRNIPYESIAVYLKFPCIYIGCNESIAWGSVSLHEFSCQFRTFRCIIDNCNYDLNTGTVINHFKKCHPNSIMSLNATLPCSPDTLPDTLDNELCHSGMLIYRNVPYFFIEIGFHDCSGSRFPKRLIFNVFRISHLPELLTYTVTLSSDCEESDIVGKVRKMIAGRSVKNYNDRIHCVGCSLRKCKSEIHKFSLLYNCKFNPLILFDASHITSYFSELRNIYYCISFEADSPLTSENECLIRKTVECPICEHYMQAPIYSCTIGHIVCNMCAEGWAGCPTCHENITTFRNFTLEALCESIRLPCRNRGCHVIDSLKNLEVHENSCGISKASENHNKRMKVE